MERTPENNSFNHSTTQNPAQNELDLGFNHMEPITPKKTAKSEPSFFAKTFDKATSVFAKKDNAEPTQFNVRKEPTFGQPTPTEAKLPDKEEFDRQVEAIRKGKISQQQAASVSNGTQERTYGQAVAQSKGIAPHTVAVNTPPPQREQISQPAAFTPTASQSKNYPPSQTTAMQAPAKPTVAEVTSPQPQNLRSTDGFTATQTTSTEPQTSVSRVYPDTTLEHPRVQVTTEFVELASTQLKAETVEKGITQPVTVSPQPRVQTATEQPNTVSTPPQPKTQTMTGFSDAMPAQAKVETVNGFSDAVIPQTPSQTTQGFTDVIKNPQPVQTINGFSNAMAEQQTDIEKMSAEKPPVVEIPKTETVAPQLQNIDSLADSIATQVKTQLTDEHLHHTESTNNQGVSEVLEQQTTSDSGFSRSQTETPMHSSAKPLTISIEKEIHTTAEQKSLQNDGFFDRTSLSNAIPDVTVQPTVEKELSAEDDFVNEFRTLQTKSNETTSSDDEFLNEFEAIRAKNQTENEERGRNKKMKNPENWSIMQKLPPKHRRLFIAVLGLLVLLIAFFWLKPNSPTVEDFQAQTGNNNLPIEFQPLDQSQNIEDHSAPTTQETAQQNNVQPPPENQTEQTAPAENTSGETTAGVVQTAPQVEATTVLMQESTTLAQSVLQLPAIAESSADTTETAGNNAQAAEGAQPKSASERIKAMEQRASGQQPSQKQPKLSRAEREKQQREAKKAAQNHQTGEDQLAEPISAGRAKTLTIPSGVSLMQVFRDNNLHIADVNAMSKAAGGNVLSNFKPGDKVQVVVNAQGRVNILRLSNGATFTRQANGTYRYHP